MTYGIIGKGTGRHQEKRLSILQQPNLKFSANFTNSIIRKRVEGFLLKYNAAAMNLRRNESTVWQSKTLGLRMLVLRLQFHSHFFAAVVLDEGVFLPKPVVFSVCVTAQLPVSWQQHQCTHLLLVLERGPVPWAQQEPGGVNCYDVHVSITTCWLYLNKTAKKHTNSPTSTGEIKKKITIEMHFITKTKISKPN